MTEPEEVSAKIEEIFETKLHVTIPSRHADLMELGILDSLILVRLLTELERQFGITVSLADVDLDSFQSVHCIATFVFAQSGGHSGGEPDSRGK